MVVTAKQKVRQVSHHAVTCIQMAIVVQEASPPTCIMPRQKARQPFINYRHELMHVCFCISPSSTGLEGAQSSAACSYLLIFHLSCTDDSPAYKSHLSCSDSSAAGNPAESMKAAAVVVAMAVTSQLSTARFAIQAAMRAPKREWEGVHMVGALCCCLSRVSC